MKTLLLKFSDKSTDDPESLQSEIHNWLHSSKQSSKRTSNRGTSKLDSASDFSDSDLDMRTTGGIRGIFENCYSHLISLLLIMAIFDIIFSQRNTFQVLQRYILEHFQPTNMQLQIKCYIEEEILPRQYLLMQNDYQSLD